MASKKKASAKQYLAQARECIQTQNWEEGAKCCKLVLKKDQSNYGAWLFMGKCCTGLEMLEQAQKSYRKAAELKPEQVHPWQGMMETVEALIKEGALLKEGPSPDEKEKTLLETYAEALQHLETMLSESLGESKKYLVYKRNLARALFVLSDWEASLDRWEWLLRREEAASSDSDDEEVLSFNIHGEKEKAFVWGKILMCFRRLVEQKKREKSALKSKLWEVVRKECHGVGSLFVDELLEMELSTDQNREHCIDVCLELIEVQPTCSMAFSLLLEALQDDPDTTSEADKRLRSSAPRLQREFIHSFPHHSLSQVILGSWILKTSASDGDVDLTAHPSQIVVRSAKKAVSQAQFASDDDAEALLKAALEETDNAAGRAQLAAHYQARGMHKTAASTISTALAYCKGRCAAWGRCSMKLMQEKLLILLAHTYVLSNKPLDAERVFQKVISQIGPSLSATEGLAELALARKDLPAAATLFQEVLDQHDPENTNAIAKLGKVALDSGEPEKAEQLLIKSMDNAAGSHHHLSHYWLALAFWEQGGAKKTAKNLAHRQLLLSAKAEPCFAPAFARLGTYYAEVDKDAAKAKKCYEKALALDAVNREAGIALTTMYEDEGKHSKALAVYRDVTKKNSRAKWAWTRLADYHAEKEQYQDAQGCYQAVLRVDANDISALSGLAVAYKSQGKHVAAMKAYDKALVVQPNSPAIKCSLADLQLEIGMIAEAIDNYRAALAIAEGSATVHKCALLGLAESHLVLSENQVEDGMYAHAAATVRSCIQSAQEALECAGAEEDFIVWKILGDAFTSTSDMNDDYFAAVSVPAIQESPISPTLAAYLVAGGLAYARALALQPSIPELHSDIAVNKWKRANLLQTGSSEWLALAGEASEHMKKAIELDPTQEEFWVSLAIMSEADPAYQQHILCVLLEAKPKCVEAWMQLAILNIRQNRAEEAYECITKAQTLDPEQDTPWLGLAVMSELECTAEGRKRATQLYVHAFSINPNSPFTQLSTGYMAGLKGGQWKEAMLPLVKYVEQKPRCSLGWTLLGIMEERRGILSAAKKSFKTAIQLVLQEEKTSNSVLVQEPDHDATVVLASTGVDVSTSLKKRRAFLNLARVLVRLDEYEAAVKIYTKTFQPSISVEANQAEYYAIALQKAGRHKDAVQLLSTGVLAGAKGGILLALVYFDEGKHSKAASVISSCVKQFPESRAAWKTMADIALAMGDGAMAKQCVAGLEPLQEQLLFYKLLVSANIADGNLEEAKKCFSRILHQHPDNLELYLAFGDFLLTHMPTETKLMQFVLTNAFSLLSSARLPPTCDMEVERLLSMGRLVRHVGRVGKGSVQKALELSRRKALQSIHLSPQCFESWHLLAEAECALALLLSSNSMGRSAAQAAARARQLAHSSPVEGRVICQLLLLESLSLTEAGDHENGAALALQVQNRSTTPDEKAAALVAIGRAHRAAGQVQEAESSFKKACTECPADASPVAELTALLHQDGRKAEAVTLSSEAMANDSFSKSGRIRILLHGVIPLLQAGDTTGAQALVEKANKGVGRQHAVLQFLSGLSFIAAKQPKRAVRPLERCLALDPGMPFANFALMQAHLALKQPDLAESDALFELDSNPAFDLPCLVLAKLAEQQKLPAKAAQFYSRGAELAPERAAYAAGLLRTKAKQAK